MSWSGPVAGAAPYPPQFPNGQPPYGAPQPTQYGQQPAYGNLPPGPTYPVPGPPHRPPTFQPPKKKGNPIITRYPPPPGYRGPAQPQSSFGPNRYPNQYQVPQPGFSHPNPALSAYPNQGNIAPPTPQGYSPQAYGPHPSTYPSPAYPTAQNYQWPQQGYHANQPHLQAQNHQDSQGYAPPTSSYPTYPPQPAPLDPSPRSFGQGSMWPPHNGQVPHAPGHPLAYNGPHQPTSQAFDVNATPTRTTAHAVASPASQMTLQPTGVKDENNAGEKPQLFLAWDDWDFDFEGAIWPKSNEPVDPNLSLGVIIWHPAKQVTRALPSTFDEAEEQALKPVPEGLDNGESVSVYFMAENSHEAFLDVRQTDDWESIRHDPVFVVFSDEDMRQNLVSLEDCIAQRDRPDEQVETLQRDDDEEMPDASWNVMDHLEQALVSTRRTPQSRAVGEQEATATDFSQEDILAKLGVTGAPKPPSDEPILPNFHAPENSRISLPEKPVAKPSLPPSSQSIPQRAQSYGGHQAPDSTRPAPRPYGSMSSGNGYRHRIPPPPPPPEPQRYGSPARPQYNGQRYDGSRGSPARSEGSNHTMVGSDFEPEKSGSNPDKEGSAVPAPTRSDSSFSRKRSYEDSDHGDERARQQDDFTKRKRRSQVDAAYSRR